MVDQAIAREARGCVSPSSAATLGAKRTHPESSGTQAVLPTTSMPAATPMLTIATATI
jgi:hypothetical protein